MRAQRKGSAVGSTADGVLVVHELFEERRGGGRPREARQPQQPRVEPHAHQLTQRGVEHAPVLTLRRRHGSNLGVGGLRGRRGGCQNGAAVHGRQQVGAHPDQKGQPTLLLREPLEDTLLRRRQNLSKRLAGFQLQDLSTAFIGSCEQRTAAVAHRGLVHALPCQDREEAETAVRAKVAVALLQLAAKLGRQHIVAPRAPCHAEHQVTQAQAVVGRYAHRAAQE